MNHFKRDTLVRVSFYVVVYYGKFTKKTLKNVSFDINYVENLTYDIKFSLTIHIFSTS